ncbi:hypothetical protein ABB37_04607 [Leptomonas pyrrhocoris]|uniref:F-box domain-containing protein n=1 Tax=Leptomonas pyrrhocoris TaxID=157538 RepID=A0A0M9G1C0_LEPPY|nr:hypothetical protein ABB37_04607 [Leptomonas pyrrhocoris]KPA80335.1 hypothetical protein ABB37_04607 [Leptomonas pyrrhocoris]|eukprot:XP_015658774.1 hypothetical protein ABB37_04607 [Leptomonas pyrrhocoris]
MLPSFQHFAQDGARSLSSNVNFACLRPPHCYEDSLSSGTAGRTIVVEDRPSPAALLCISVPLPMKAAKEDMQFLTAEREVAGLVRSPASRCAPRRKLDQVSSSAEFPISDATRYLDLCSDTSAAEKDEGDTDSRNEFDCTSISNACDTSVNTSVAASRQAGWGVVWMHVFPQHIAGFLTVRDVVEVSAVCRTAQEAVRQPWVWRSLAAYHYAVHPVSVERVFYAAAQEWSTDVAAAGGYDSDVYQRPTRLIACEQLVASTSPVLRQPQLTPRPQQNIEEDAQASTMSTATAPWLMGDNAGTSAAEDAVEVGEEEADNSSNDGEGPDWEFPSTQPPRTTREEDNDFIETMEEETAERSAVMAIAPSSTTTDAATTDASIAAAAAAAQLAPRTSLASGSRYLWQTTAAAMPSPSSPISSPLPEGAGEEDNALYPSATVGVVVHRTLMPSPQLMAGSGSPVTGANSLSGLTSPRSPAAAVAAAAAVNGTLCATPIALTHSQRSTPLTPPLPVYTTIATCADGPTSAVEQRGGAGDKCLASSRTAVREELPPPSPAQLDSSSTEGILFHPEEKGGEDAMTQSTPFSSPTLLCQPSYTLGVTNNVPVANADGGVASPASSAAAAAAPSSPAASSPAVVPMCCYTLCRATAERTLLHRKPNFPWYCFSRYLYANRVQASMSRWVELSRRARAELCRGAWDAAYGSLSHIIHDLLQQGSCRGVEHLLLLAQTLVRRASLCCHRGHVHLLAAFTDFCTAALLCPDSVAPSDMTELCAREGLSTLSPEAWMRSYEDAAQIASPVVLLGTLAQVPFLFPQHRILCLCGCLAAYMRAYRVSGQSLHHLLCRAAEWATPGTVEELLVRALREVAQAQQYPQHASALYVRKACATADYALSLMPLQVRTAVDALTSAWVRDCFSTEAAVYGAAMTQWAARAPEAAEFAGTTALDVRWLAWLTYEVQTFVYKELTDKPPVRAALASVLLALTAHDRADGLVRIAAQYANYETRTEDLVPPLPRHADRRRVTQHLLHNALHLSPLHSSAALLLSRVYAVAEDEEGEAEGGASMASAVLTDCIHRWARRFSLLELGSPSTRLTATAVTAAGSTVPYLHRRERSPEVCFIPSELLVERNGCLHMVADLAEATEQHQGLSYPYQMRAAMAMDRGYHLAAILEMGRIIKLSLDVNDVALRVRFLQDATELPSTRASLVADEASAAALTPTQSFPASSLSASFESSVRVQDASSPALSLASPPSPSLGSAPPLRSTHRACLARMSGLLTLLHPPEAFLREECEGDSTGLVGAFGGSQSCSRLLFSRELPSMATRELGNDHVSRVASMAFSEAEGDVVLPNGVSAVNAAHVRAFLEDLLSCTNDAPGSVS